MKISKNMIIGMIHLPALPGYESHPGMDEVIKKSLGDLKCLEDGGVDAVLIENEGDQPHQVEASPEIISAMTVVVREVVEKAGVYVGLEVLLNDPKSSLAIAKISGADFIRIDYFVDRMSREEHGGEMEIDPRGLMDYRKKIDAENVLIFTDIQVKYAKLLEKGKKISISALQAIEAGSDGVIVSGDFTGEEPDISDLIEVKNTVGDFPLFVGSGFSNKNADSLLKFADGAMVGTSIKEGDLISLKKTMDLIEVVRSINN